MSFITDFIQENAVKIMDDVSLPNNLKEQVIKGVSESIFRSMRQTANKEGGIDQLMELFSCRESATSSSITALASNLFSTDIAKKLGLSPSVVKTIVPMIPMVIEQFTSQNKIDINDFVSEVTKTEVADNFKKATGDFSGYII